MEYVFGDYRLDPARRRLTIGESTVEVEPKVLDFIALLVRNRARVVPTPAITASLWPDTIVSDSALHRVVKEARRAIGDDGRTQHSIRTFSRYGYRFVGEVVLVGKRLNRDRVEAIERARVMLDELLDRGAARFRAQLLEYHDLVESLLSELEGDL